MSAGQGGDRKSKDMRLKIVDCRQVYSSRNQRGDPYTIYEIDAERAADGVRINQKLRAFTALPIGQVVEVTVTPFVSERHGKSFTLSPKDRPSGGGSTEKLNELQREVEDLRTRFAHVSNTLTDVMKVLREKGIITTAQQAAPVQANSAALDAEFGADAPF